MDFEVCPGFRAIEKSLNRAAGQAVLGAAPFDNVRRSNLAVAEHAFHFPRDGLNTLLETIDAFILGPLDDAVETQPMLPQGEIDDDGAEMQQK